jgi:hypothetical protein
MGLAKMLELAEAGKLKFECEYCDHTWTPSPAEQKGYAIEINKHLKQP